MEIRKSQGLDPLASAIRHGLALELPMKSKPLSNSLQCTTTTKSLPSSVPLTGLALSAWCTFLHPYVAQNAQKISALCLKSSVRKLC